MRWDFYLGGSQPEVLRNGPQQFLRNYMGCWGQNQTCDLQSQYLHPCIISPVPLIRCSCFYLVQFRGYNNVFYKVCGFFLEGESWEWSILNSFSGLSPGSDLQLLLAVFWGPIKSRLAMHKNKCPAPELSLQPKAIRFYSNHNCLLLILPPFMRANWEYGFWGEKIHQRCLRNPSGITLMGFRRSYGV